MRTEAIGDGAIGGAGRAMLTTDFGRTRLAEILKANGETRAAGVGRDQAAEARRHAGTAATRP